jgi:hypothetical protein
MSSNRVTIQWTGSKARADALLAAVVVDDPEAFEISVTPLPDGDACLTLSLKDDRLRTIRATVDDLLACLSAAESALEANLADLND